MSPPPRINDVPAGRVSLSGLPEGYRLAELDDTADRERMLDLLCWGFALEPPPEDGGHMIWEGEPRRSVGVWDERGVLPGSGENAAPARLAAIHSSYALRLPVPGGAHVPTSGLSMVVVHPGHRRRGIARAMLSAHMARSLERGETISALYAAESGIYGRYGYGAAIRETSLRLGRGAQLHPVADSEDLVCELDTLDAEGHGPVIEQVHRAVSRPGWITRDSAAIRARHLLDKPSERRDHERLRVLIVRDQTGKPRAYALFRRQRKSSETGSPQGVVKIREAVALDAAAARALWGTLTDLDLMGSVETGHLAMDDPLVHLLGDLRPTEQKTSDGLWLRLLDVPAALAARAYAGPADVVLELRDPLVPANDGRWHLRTAEDGTPGALPGSAEATEEEAHVVLGVAELAEIYLGGTSLAALAAAGRVAVRDAGRLHAAATAFSWPVAPAMSWGF